MEALKRELLESEVSYSVWAIRAGIAGLIAVLLALVAWLAVSKDTNVVGSIHALTAQQEKWQEETRKSDQKIMESLNKVCDRIGMVEGRVSNLEIFIQMPYEQRQKLLDRNGKKNNGAD